MNLVKSTLAVTSYLLLTGCVVVSYPSYAGSDLVAEKELTLPSASLKTLDVEAGAGELIIEGKDGISEITVNAKVYADDSDFEDYTLTLDTSGKTAKLVSEIDNSFSWGDGPNAYIDVRVTVPSELFLSVEDGSGSMHITSMKNGADITDGSGSLVIENVAGEVKVNDGSGSLTISSVTGNLDVNDGSGSLEISEVGGSLEVNDGSGSIEISNVGGDANIDDGSGSLTVRDVKGVVTIDDGSGGIDVRRAGGVNIIEAGSGGLTIKDVEGNFEIDS
ncbi:DUF4097 family beta strand repeat-containing protein [Thalassotalea agarivorans]|uniref:Adhesin n=1 Tax=Thalassotalea agarivorans TaxID=349064 RepID=A0A1I0HYG4_THASX|nr:hypothetical protein [Thalassotalea agarivorans]SET89135.1 hypothetical protein SAMN05660429_02985 [Thalassotalea agarivorans]